MSIFDGLLDSIGSWFGSSTSRQSDAKGSFPNFGKDKAELQNFKGRKQPSRKPLANSSGVLPDDSGSGAPPPMEAVAVVTVDPQELRCINSDFFNVRRCQVWMQTAHVKNFDLRLFFCYVNKKLPHDLEAQVVEFVEAAEKAYDPNSGLAQVKQALVPTDL